MLARHTRAEGSRAGGLRTLIISGRLMDKAIHFRSRSRERTTERDQLFGVLPVVRQLLRQLRGKNELTQVQRATGQRHGKQNAAAVFPDLPSSMRRICSSIQLCKPFNSLGNCTNTTRLGDTSVFCSSLQTSATNRNCHWRDGEYFRKQTPITGCRTFELRELQIQRGDERVR